MRRLAQFVRLRASRVSRLRLSRVCVHLSRVRLASVCVRLACVSRLSASVSRLRLFTSRVPNACVSRLACVGRLVRLSSCASASVSRLASVRLSRVCLASVRLSRVCLASICLASVCVGRLVSRVSVCPCECLRELAHFMRRSSFKEFKRFFAIVILSYNVPMPKYPSHHLIYVFYHPMPIMPLY